MYSSFESVTKKIDQKTLIELLNDEARADVAIDLTDPLDLINIRFNEAAEQSQAEIDPYLRGRYTLPFSDVPKIITSLSDNFTIYHIYERRFRDNMPDSYLSIRKEGLKMLEQIQKGNLDLGVDDEPQSLANEITTNKTSSDKIFNSDMWNKY